MRDHMQKLFQQLMREYAHTYEEIRTTQNFKHPFGSLIRKDITDAIRKNVNLDQNQYIIKGSCGAGRWTSVPWIAVFDKRITTSAQRGVYVVYLLNKDEKELYLTLNQGATDVSQDGAAEKDGKLAFTGIAGSSNAKSLAKLKEKAREIRGIVGTVPFNIDEEIKCGASNYDSGAVCYKKYTLENLPDDKQLLEDLNTFVNIYAKYAEWYLDQTVESNDDSWWPSQEKYPLNLTKDDWKKYLFEIELPSHPSPMKMLKGMMELGNEASCKQLSDTYGGHPSAYAGCAMNLGRRVKKYFNLPACMDRDQERYFPFPFVGKYRGGNEDNYIYKIRPELLDALKEIDLSGTSPYYEEEHKIGIFDSWEIVDETTAIKTCDKSFFEHKGSGVPKNICWFFDAEDIPNGESNEVKLIFDGNTYLGKVRNDTTDRRRIQIFWNTDLASCLEKHRVPNAIATFKKISKDKYEITMSKEGEKEMTVLENVINALKSIGGKGTYSQIYEAYETVTNEPLTDGKKAGIRACIERNSSDSNVFSGNDIFYSVEGKGKGVWGLRDYLPQMEQVTTKDKLNAIKAYIAAKGFNYEGDLIENFYLSLKSKPFVILAGTSGTGKTRLVKLFAEAIGAEMKLVPVRPDWSDSSDLFGHTDLSNNFHPGAIIDFIKKAEWNKDKPFFLCLDEMNLARVEYYLSDFLSIIETRDRKENGDIETDALVDVDYYKNKEAQGKYGRVFIPENLYIVGTVNMDETTFPFSKKVLDRANTIEFSFVNLMSKPMIFDAIPQKLNEDNSFLKTEYLYLRDCDDSNLIDNVCFDLEALNQILVKANLHVGYRVRDEISFYMMNNKKAGLLSEDAAFDHEIMQKILPRVQGSSSAIKDVLSELFVKCAGDYSGFGGVSTFEQMNSYIDQKDCKYPNSAKKIAFMMRRYEEDGFTSYWL